MTTEGNSQTSGRLQQAHYFFLEDSWVRRPDVAARDAAFAGDRVRYRQPEDFTIDFAGLGIAQYYRIVHVEFLIKLAHRFRAVVHGDAQDLQPLRPVLVLHLDKARNLFPARRAPGGPEIK